MDSGVDRRNRDSCQCGIEFRKGYGAPRLNLPSGALGWPQELQSFKILIDDTSHLSIVPMDCHQRFHEIVDKSSFFSAAA